MSEPDEKVAPHLFAYLDVVHDAGIARPDASAQMLDWRAER